MENTDTEKDKRRREYYEELYAFERDNERTEYETDDWDDDQC